MWLVVIEEHGRFKLEILTILVYKSSFVLHDAQNVQSIMYRSGGKKLFIIVWNVWINNRDLIDNYMMRYKKKNRIRITI